MQAAPKPKKKQVQPKHHAGKSRQVAKLRREKIVKDIIAGKTQEQAGIRAGLNPKSAYNQVSKILQEPTVAQNFKDLLCKTIPDDFHANTFRECMEATKVISANVIAVSGEGMSDAHSMTKDFIDVPDFAVRRATAVDVAKLKGYMVEAEAPKIPTRVEIEVIYRERNQA